MERNKLAPRDMVRILKRETMAVFVRVVLVAMGMGYGGGVIDQAFSEIGIPAVLKQLAADYSEKGFKLRKEHWSGKLEAGQARVVKQQLFRGNEYWFWAADANGGHSLAVEIFDDSGNAVSLEKFSDKGVSGARVLPVKTATYLVKVEADMGNQAVAGEIDWALAYGYR